MNQDIEVVGPPPEPLPAYIMWRSRAIACVILFIVAAHALVWFSTWSDKRGNSYMEICGIWLVVTAIASIASIITYAECKENYQRGY